MKFWELVSAFRDQKPILSSTLCSSLWYVPYGEWYKGFSSLVKEQDREKLDSTVPDELVKEVAGSVGDALIFYLGGGYLRRHPLSQEDLKLNALEVVTKFGGSALEEVSEYGSYQVKT